jgi:hypothetical protein
VPDLEPQRPPAARPSCRPLTRRARPRGGAASTTSDRPAPQTRRQLAMGLNAVSLLPQRTWLAANRNHVDPCPKPSCPWPNHRQQPGGQRHSIEARPALSHRPLQELELSAALLQERGLAAISTRTLGRPSLERTGLSPTKHPRSTSRLQNPPSMAIPAMNRATLHAQRLSRSAAVPGSGAPGAVSCNALLGGVRRIRTEVGLLCGLHGCLWLESARTQVRCPLCCIPSRSSGDLPKPFDLRAGVSLDRNLGG